MSDAVREAVAQAIWEAITPWTWSLANSAQRLRYLDVADAAIKAHLSALGEGGYTLVKHPEPCGCGHEWKAADSTVFYTPGDEITDVCFVAPVTGSGEAQLVYVKDPKALAAALLAADAKADAEAEK